jgi:hypothetical protein
MALALASCPGHFDIEIFYVYPRAYSVWILSRHA